MKSSDTHTHSMLAYQSHGEPERLYIVAGTYWKIMLAIEIVILCTAIAGSSYMLVTTFFDFSENNSEAALTQPLNRSQLKQTVQGFENRKIYFQELEAGGSQVSDPWK